MLTVLFSAPYMIPVLDRFAHEIERHGIKLIIADVHERLSEAEILYYAGQFDGAICGDDHYTSRVLKACAPRLKVISKWGTGIDSIDQPVAASLGIQVCRTLDAFTQPVADSVMGYILAFARRQPWLDRAMKSGQWEKISGYSLGERSLGVIGVGNIGRAVLRRAKVFGMQLLGNDIVEIPQDFIQDNGVEMISLRELLARSDYVSLNCDLNPTSYHIINADTLDMMNPSSVLINTARGPLVNEPDLVEALASGKIAGAALDVFENEPLPFDSPLLRMDHVLLAPHNANSSPRAYERVHRSTLNNLYAGFGLQLEPDA